MNRKSTPGNNLMRALGAIIFIAILAISATNDPSLERLVVPIVVIMVIGMSIARIVYAQFSRGSDGGTSMSGGGGKLAMMMVVLGLMGAGAAVYFLMGQRGGSPALPEVLRWAPLAGAVDALFQWGGLLIVGGLIAVVGAVVLIVVLRRSSELPGGPSTPWDPDNPA